MKIIPVIDLMSGHVVRGVAGERERYRPVESVLCDDASPVSVADGFAAALGPSEVYIADLDAIGGGPPTIGAYRAIASAGHSLWVDAGIADPERARVLADLTLGDRPLAGVVAGLETIDSPASLAAVFGEVGAERLIFSLDLRDGRPLSDSPGWQDLSPLEIGTAALEIGVRRVIVLDLARVGVAEGVGTESICRELRHRAPHLEIIAGGGIRSLDDLRSLARSGCDAALVATALHNGTIGRAELQQLAHDAD